MMRAFRVHNPRSVAESSALLEELGPDAAAYAGGTELLLVMKRGLVQYAHLVNLKHVDALRGLELDPGAGVLRVGALVTHRELEQSPIVKTHLPCLAELERHVANVRVRNTGTIGGNLCFAEPHSDPAVLLLTLNARVHVWGQGCTRVIPVSEFLLGPYQTALGPGEILTHIEVPIPPPATARAAYRKFQIHERPSVGVAVYVERGPDGFVHCCRVAIGSIEDVPRRLPEVEERVRNRVPTGRDVEDAAQLVAGAVNPVDDLSGSAEYKRHLAAVLFKRALERCLRG